MDLAVASDLTRGSRLGKYEILHRIAAGGMAEIYLARLTGLQGFAKHVVIKRILPQLASSPEFVRMFLTEARIAGSLDHPNIAQVYDVGHDQGQYFFAMEYLHGEDLRPLLRTLGQAKRRLPLEHAIAIAAGAAAGLHFAHERVDVDGTPLGIVHRDVSPSNVVVQYSGGVKLVDFGIAKIASANEITRVTTFKGKASYMSPEQCRNDPVDRRSDVFALGIVLYELTTQHRAFKAESELAVLKMIESTDVAPPTARVPGYPPALERIVLKALSRDRDQRYATAHELQLELEAFAQEHGLVRSAAALGEFVTEVLGAKREPWYDLPSAAAVEATRPTPDPSAEDRAEQETPALGHTLLRRRRVRRRKAIARVLIFGALAAAGGFAVSRLTAREDGPAAGPPATVLLVAERGEATRELAPAAPPLDPGAAAPPKPAAAAPAPRPAPRHTEVTPSEALSGVFARQRRRLEACFRDHAADVVDSPELVVRFAIEADGYVAAVEVLPADLARTPLGACVAEVARGIEFGRQDGPLAFRIPVKVRRRAGASPP